MIMHVDGTLIPNAPALPEYMKADVYLPPPFIRENLVTSSSVAAIVQRFIEDLAVPAAIRWRQAGSNTPGLRWKFSGGGGPADVPTRNNPDLPLVPSPIISTSSRRIFFGRSFGSLGTLSNDASTLSTPPSSPSNLSFHDDGDDGEQTVASLQNELAQLKVVLSSASDQEQESQRLIKSLRDEVQLLSTRLSTTITELGAARSGIRQPSPPVFKEENISHVPRASSPSKALRHAFSATPATSITREDAVVSPGNIFQSGNRAKTASSSRAATVTSPTRSHSPIKSFGPESSRAIAHYSLSHRVHRTLHDLFEEFTMESWADELSKIFPDNIVEDLVAAMRADVGEF
jgi:hypothetical protein